MYEIISIFLGIISIGLAISLNKYHFWKQKQIQHKNEAFFVKQIQNNLKEMMQYFLTIEMKTTHNEEYEESSDSMVYELEDFYLRNGQKMKDILQQTRFYLSFWNEVSIDDRQTIDDVLSIFSWLIYEYYPLDLSPPLRKNKVISFRQIFFEKKMSVMNNTNTLLQKYSS